MLTCKKSHIRLLHRNKRYMQIRRTRCFWPPLRLIPFSPICNHANVNSALRKMDVYTHFGQIGGRKHIKVGKKRGIFDNLPILFFVPRLAK